MWYAMRVIIKVIKAIKVVMMIVDKETCHLCRGKIMFGMDGGNRCGKN